MSILGDPHSNWGESTVSILILLMRTLRARSAELTTHCDSTPDWLLPDPIHSIWIYVLSLISHFPCLGEISVTFNSS